MANVFYDKAREDFATAQLDWLTTNVFAVLVDASYVFDATETDLTAISAAYLSGMTPQALTGLAVTSTGTVSADSSVFAGVTSGQTAAAVIIYADQGAGRFDPILYYDTGAGFPLTTTGASVTVDWNATALNGTLYSTN